MNSSGDKAVGLAAMMNTPDLEEGDFYRIARLMHRCTGVHLGPSKLDLVRSRLATRLRFFSLMDFGSYVDLLEHPRAGDEIATMVDLLTTNKTSFFREQGHFDFLRESWRPEPGGAPHGYKFWCAGCSFGHEPFSLAIWLKESTSAARAEKIRILATDISRPALEKARAGIYDSNELNGVPPELARKYFHPCAGRKSMFRINSEIQKMVRFARLNLVGQWPMRGPFEAIFCRNVMIYFNTEVRQALVDRFYRMLRRGGYFFIGHSESLSGLSHGFRLVQPAVYVREGI